MLATLLWVASLPQGAVAGDRLQLSAARVEGAGWTVTDLLLAADLEAQSLAASAAAVALGPAVAPLRSLSFHCALVIERGRIGCTEGSLEAQHPWLKGAIRGLALSLDPAAGRGSLGVEALATSAGSLRATVEAGPGTVQLSAQGKGLDAGELARMARDLAAGWPPLQAQGRVSLDLRLALQGGAQRLDTALTVADLALGDGSGLRQAEGLTGSVRGYWQGRAWPAGHFAITSELDSGAGYLDPLYLEHSGDQPWKLETSGGIDGERLLLNRASLDMGASLQLQAAGSVPWNSPAMATVTIGARSQDLGSAYGALLSPFLAATPAADLQLGGQAEASLVLRDGQPRALHASLAGVRLSDPAGRVGLEELDLAVKWASSGGPWPARLYWRQGTFYRLPFGSAAADFLLQPGALFLERESRVAFLGGEVALEALRASTGEDGLAWELSGRVTGVDLAKLSGRLEWPPLTGDLSGIVPTARYQRARFELGGALLVRVFDGTLTVTDLVLERPLGPVPRLQANVELANIDLERLTRTFSLGRIEGQLQGYVRQLELVDWRPVQFDAYLGTPEGDRSRRRISQRAVNEIAALGGSPAPVAALSRGVLRLFSDFSYRRLGIRCRLRGGVCEMDGIAPATQGYYLVEGSGVPQINVIGFERRVDWAELIARVVAASKSEGPVIGPGESQ